MIKNCTLLLFVIVIFSSCKKSQADLLSRKWQQVSFENPSRDQDYKDQQAFIDTFGKHTTPEENMKAYGTTNVDSFRQVLQANMDSFKVMEKRTIENTQFDFRKNGVVYIISSNIKDSANWKLEPKNVLVLDEKKLKGMGSKLNVEVITLTESALKIKFSENHSSAIANFVPAKN